MEPEDTDKSVLQEQSRTIFYDLRQNLIKLRSQDQSGENTESLAAKVAELMTRLYDYHLSLYQLSGKSFNSAGPFCNG